MRAQCGFGQRQQSSFHALRFTSKCLTLIKPLSGFKGARELVQKLEKEYFLIKKACFKIAHSLIPSLGLPAQAQARFSSTSLYFNVAQNVGMILFLICVSERLSES